ncbi:bifunctional 3-deoxy-7-phosphoheptulonate synthase/chorismate mutase type II [Aquimarina algicola]|uniref:chorismate mutase n=1 Tax=Aquimarina algicola TaxID=2589995 RepID=A0A504J9K0_9FLAO|nr:bifunctional 3-deoxy-7-phosphoheptulonate synthase/chorismate mutase type II [Aquimarina algicola]TPN83340.1 3-deoxy-7-phosphoheptulonate synthase [Aquimarina algicola]
MKNKKEFRNWLNGYNSDHPLVIAGPCSAETEDQVIRIAHQLRNSDATVMRAGIWKPRTRPGNFEGVGALGLKWLQRAKNETGMKIAIEVANPYHVELALQHEIDILWIGARSTVSPFIVQEIANACKGIDNPVLIKNPINPDLALWLGAVERFHMAGVNNLGVIHRGFSTFEKTRYRNIPEWQIPIDLQSRFPDLPIFLDPSHIAGRRDLIFDLCQIGLDLNFDGLIIESHYDPDNAWSDAAQQITPDMLIQYLNYLKLRKEIGQDKVYQKGLNKLRTEIDILDNQLIDTLSKRMKISKKIENIKTNENFGILHSERCWKKTIEKIIVEKEQPNLNEEFILRVFEAIHQKPINQHSQEVAI